MISGMDEVAIKKSFVGYASARLIRGGAVARIEIAQFAMIT